MLDCKGMIQFPTLKFGLSRRVNWFNEFKRGLSDLTGDLREGRPSAAAEDGISAVRLVIDADKSDLPADSDKFSRRYELRAQSPSQISSGQEALYSRRSGNSSGANQKIIVLPGLAILAPPRVYVLCLGTGGTALFTALLIAYNTKLNPSEDQEPPPPAADPAPRAPPSRGGGGINYAKNLLIPYSTLVALRVGRSHRVVSLARLRLRTLLAAFIARELWGSADWLSTMGARRGSRENALAPYYFRREYTEKHREIKFLLNIDMHPPPPRKPRLSCCFVFSDFNHPFPSEASLLQSSYTLFVLELAALAQCVRVHRRPPAVANLACSTKQEPFNPQTGTGLALRIRDPRLRTCAGGFHLFVDTGVLLSVPKKIGDDSVPSRRAGALRHARYRCRPPPRAPPNV
ncbi:hypothetical protein EVAR_7387_1 [Eumeta japonica]|uniref:Uncharacterized protein n=1 Tax=Eumeta variegata TaxID=151549 RepID=A0A4C1V7A6_EUMVA|nr:hypothetical protein EVAR_7387_1 [Eumeta japonica]